MKCKTFKLLLFYFCCGFLFFGYRVNAESLTGAWTMYVQNSNGNNLPQNYSSTIPGITFPSSSYTQLSGSTVNQNPNIFTVVTRVDLQPTYTYVKGNYYTITVNFETGSYIIPYFPTNSSNWFVASCTNSLCNTTPSVTYNYIIDSTHQGTNTLQVVIKFTATANTSNSTILLGNLTDAKGNFYNQYSGQQGIRISSATIDYVDNSVDFTPVIESNEQNTQNIINNNNQNTQTIINNQNENTQQQIESQQVCNTVQYSSSSSGNTVGKYLSDSGVPTNGANYTISDFISISHTSHINVINSGFNNSCFYDSNKNFISCVVPSSIGPLSVPSNAKFFRITFSNSYNIPIIEIDVCKNGNQALSDNIEDLKEGLLEHEPPDMEDFLHDIESLELSDTPITDLLLMPIRMIQAFYNGISGQCTTVNLGTWSDTLLYIPCIDLESILGSSLWGAIDILFSGFMILNIAQLIIHDFDSFSSAEDLFDETYTPRHHKERRSDR